MEEKLQKINDKIKKIINSKAFNYVCLILGIFIIVFYMYLYSVKQPIVDEEVRPEVTNNLIPWEVKDGDNVLTSFVSKTFNLNITEYGQYRPRWLAFATQFVDENIFLHVVRAVPSFGNRLPFYYLAALLTVIACFYFFRVIWKKGPKGLQLLLSTSLIMFQNYQVTTYWRARSAKLLAVSAVIFLIAFTINHMDSRVIKKNLKYLLLGIPIFILMTLDEQVLAIGFALCLFTYLFCILNKKINLMAIIYSLACALYISFYLWWGKSLFIYFTGGYQKHGHTICGSLSGISLKTFSEGAQVLQSVIPKLIFMSAIIFAIIWVYSIVRMALHKEELKLKLKKIATAIFLALASYGLLMLMIDAHSAIYETPVLWNSVYPMIAGIVLLLSIIYLMTNTEYKYKYIMISIMTIGIGVSLIYNVCHINNYYGAYLTQNGGFMGEVTDLVVTNDDIKTKAIPSTNIDLNSYSLPAILNTSKSTDNYQNTVILSKLNDDNSINSIFSCYLVVKENRNLNIKLRTNNVVDDNYALVYVNNILVDVININDKDISKTIYMPSEVNRASKVDIKLYGGNNNKVYLDELNMD